jgi:hypothetical protein
MRCVETPPKLHQLPKKAPHETEEHRVEDGRG